jgi:amidohydrolase
MRDIVKSARGIHEQVVRWRRALHEIPEFIFELNKTSQFVRDRLAEMGIESKVIAKTGIVAVIKGVEQGRTIALRADMDAIALKEETGLPYSSTHEGYMHACGHDAHTAMVLGAAKILSENRSLFKGNVKLLFQPAEEHQGGARQMIEEGCMENPKVDAILGLHVGPLFEQVGTGVIGIHSGTIMASIDTFFVKVLGRGGHSAMPHHSVDPITTASAMIGGLQTIVSRELNPSHPTVITVGSIKGGTSPHIIPEVVEFGGTVRTVHEKDRTYIEKRIKEVCQSIAGANRAEVEIDYRNYYPTTVNHREFTRFFLKSVEKVAGKENIVVLDEPHMGGDDVAYFLERAPGNYFVLGSNNPTKGIVYPNHHPKFNVDEDVLWIGPAVFAQAAFDFLNNGFEHLA